jgi:hypothetical protein
MMALIWPALGWLRVLLTGNGLLIAAIVGALAVFYTYDSSRVERGRTLERAKIERGESKAKSKALSARNDSRAGRGVFDPYTRSADE